MASTPAPGPGDARSKPMACSADASNQLSLASRVAVDLISAGAASLCVAPFITVVDRSIVENASGRRELWTGVRQGAAQFAFTPHKAFMLPEFRWVWGLYWNTYATANTVDTACQQLGVDPRLPKFAIVTIVNMTHCIAKDRFLTRTFGSSAVPRPLPLMSYLLFAMRDSLTIAASFNAPKIVSQWLQDKHAVAKSTADTTSQLACPCAVQFVSTPLHLLGLDIYNNPVSSPAGRALVVRRFYLESALARIGRIGPAFGIGGVGNTFFRDKLTSYLAPLIGDGAHAEREGPGACPWRARA
eukprot:CAMPEP_0198423758 /NCGR_PEP_ID=MMETSP1452-20131203/3352_1 /TAXON_ID=1181717 /ORGANISM="Synchroma pusillum, Strain CCMP3072" /LENGTH=299 /DNA_ID=CAMNT_0044144079 /DNA_START=36 /DNA_END=933 /DNA_ORIENTATION=-